MSKSAGLSQVDLVKRALAVEGEFELFNAVNAMAKRGKFEANNSVLRALSEYPEAQESYLQLVASSPQTEELIKVAQQVSQMETGEQILENPTENVTGVPSSPEPSTEEDQPPKDPQSYAPPTMLRHPATIYCELGHAYYARGERFLQSRRADLAWSHFASAAQAYSEAIGRHPKSVQLRHYLADALIRQQKPEEALKQLLEAVPLDFSSSPAALEKAHLLLTEERARHFRTLEDDWLPYLVSADFNSAVVASLYSFLGRVRLYQADYSRAIDLYEKALNLQEYDHFAIEGLATALWRSGETERAVELLRKAIDLADQAEHEGRREKLRYKLGNLLIELRSYEQAIEVVQAGLVLHGSQQTLFQTTLGRIHLLKGEYDQAAEGALAALNLDRSNVEALAVLAEAHLKKGDAASAISMAEQALEIQPDYPIALKIKAGGLVMSARDIDQAVRLLEIYLQRAPDDADAAYWRIQGLRLQGKSFQEIQAALKSAMDAVPEADQVPLLIELAQSHLQAEHTNDALATLDKIRQIQPDMNAAVLWHLSGDVNRQLQRFESAIEDYRKGLEMEPGNAELWKSLAELQAADGQLDQSVNSWERYIQISPNSAYAYIELARMQAEQKHWTAVLEAVDAAQDNSLSVEQEITVYRLKGDALIEVKGDPKEIAETYYQRALRLNGNNQLDEANPLLRQAIYLAPDHIGALWSLAENHRMLSYEPGRESEIDKSLETWKNAAINLRPPNESDSWAYLTRALISEKLLAMPGVSPEQTQFLWWEASVYVERALILGDQDANTWSYLSRYNRVIGMEFTALLATQKALAIDPENLYTLGERAACLANTGRFEEADIAISKYLELSVDSWAQAMKAYILHRQGKYMRWK